MKVRRLVLAFALLAALGTATTAIAAVRDYRLMTGTLVWPNAMPGQSLAVIRGDDGIVYVAEVAPTESIANSDRSVGLRSGNRVSMLAREGYRPGQLHDARLAIESAAVASPGSGQRDEVDAAPSAAEALGPMMLAGTVKSMGPTTLTVTTADGRTVTADVGALDAEIRSDLRPGDRVTLYVPTTSNGTPIAQGIVVDRGAPSASPGFRR